MALSERQERFFMAAVAEQAERFPEMIEQVKWICSIPNVQLNDQERNLFCCAYKGLLSKKRQAWRIIAAKEKKEESREQKQVVLLRILKDYRLKIEKEVHNVCSEVFNLLDEYLIPPCKTPESKIFYYQMKGDYNRYVAEFTSGKEHTEASAFCFSSLQIWP
eukprot:TRINITY_DN3519_c0_g1_i1.p1 TRINITY_DN3519_c0_g1~~TRINITY_DN3519_c0_g1_i1.p1  ORF type:complete len:162 (+),score=29.79 TRINITY_DN3519_c0_g1_i1:114-599(+)